MQLTDRKVIVTGGPTREWIDPVRFISNPSSGKMGLAIAEAAFQRSMETVFIHGPMEEQLIKEKDFKTVGIETTLDLQNAVLNELCNGSVLIMAAAPADYRPKEIYTSKIKKESRSEEFVLTLIKNPDILRTISRKRFEDKSLNNLFIVGFAAETDNLEFNALEKLRKKNLDMICLNDVTQKDSGFNSANNQVTIFTKFNQKIELPLLSKKETADRLLDLIEAEIQK